LLPGKVLQDNTAVAPFASLQLLEGVLSALTAVILAPSLLTQLSLLTVPGVADCINREQSPESSTSDHDPALPASAPVTHCAASATHRDVCFYSAWSEGARVRIEGLTSKPELNGRTGIVCGAFNEASGRWTVQVNAGGSQPAVRLALRPANMKHIHADDACINVSSASDPFQPTSPSVPSAQAASHSPATPGHRINQATHWQCELGLPWPKSVDYSSQCPKGHSLIPSHRLKSGCHVCGRILDSAILSEGARVRIEGLTSKPELNWRTGIVCGAFNEASGRWTVQVDAGGPCAKIRSANLKLQTSFGSQSNSTVRGLQCGSGCSYGICNHCVAFHQCAPHEPSSSSSDFPSMGVNALFLKAFRSRWGTVIGEHWTTSQVCNQLIKPLTSRGGSLCASLLASGSADVGESNLFFSHVWTEKFWNSVDAVLQLIEERGVADLQTTFIWFDVFSASQHMHVDRPSSWWMDTFKSAISKMGRLAMVLNPWDNPAALKRAWCVLELFSCASTGGRFEVAMPPAERERFLRCNRIPGLFDKMLSRINSRDATCSRETDRVSECSLLVSLAHLV
jgi:hypothetical protein